MIKMSLKKKLLSGSKMKIVLLISFSIIIICSVILGVVMFEQNLNDSENSSIDFNPSSDITNTTDLETITDSIVLNEMQQKNAVGLTISIVKDGIQLLTKGYGYSDYENEIPVYGNYTLFRIGSISKPITAIAVFQLVEQGLLDLDTNVNDYLTTFKIPDTFAQPVTLRHLLSHTAGFEKCTLYYNEIIIRNDNYGSLGEVLENLLPKRVNPPGEAARYSDWGFGLAGYIVELVSGVPFNHYAEENIFQPLGMNSTSFDQPLIPSLQQNVSLGYTNVYGSPVSEPFEYITIPPCGSVSSTALDMSKLMICFLQNGTYNGNTILTEDSMMQIKTPYFRIHPKQLGVGLGTVEFSFNKHWGMSFIGHSGGTLNFRSKMILAPKENLGFFISSNTIPDNAIAYYTIEKLLDYFYSHDAIDDVIPMTGYKDRTSMFDGYYMYNCHKYLDYPESYETYLEDNVIKFKSNPDGSYSMFGFKWFEVEPLLFRDSSQTTPVYIAFKTDDKGEIAFMSIQYSLNTLDKLDYWDFSISESDDIRIDEGDTSQLKWQIDASSWQEISYSIYQNGTNLKTDVWNFGSDIIFTNKNLAPGTYNITIEITDIFLEISKSDTVIVIVENKTTSVDASLNNNWYLFLLTTVVIYYLVRKKKHSEK